MNKTGIAGEKMIKSVTQWLLLVYVPVIALLKALLYYIHRSRVGNPRDRE
ncbi:hypothetical protein [Salinithrix halophila]|uniref:Uncharacterized protein n=1 Tax=Salinithrix halophila TaxID=1485204 RepID=A0ABV8JB32_9BACL